MFSCFSVVFTFLVTIPVFLTPSLNRMMTYKLPFGGSSMKQLIYNIVNAAPGSPSSSYTKELRELVRDTLQKSSKIRPSKRNSKILNKEIWKFAPMSLRIHLPAANIRALLNLNMKLGQMVNAMLWGEKCRLIFLPKVPQRLQSVKCSK